MARYRVITGINYPPNKRAEADEIIDDLPSASIKWLLEGGHIELVETNAKPAAKPAKDIESESEGEEQ